ncbi:MAG: phosphopentomutase [Lachnospiraceae bacterium]|nr:phosphopentomutase [Lachnospiraceae bacterium]
MNKRVFIIVLDSMGIGEAPDAALFQDEGSNTLGAIRSHHDFYCPTLTELGLFNIEGVGGGIEHPKGAFARLQERSMGKDSTIGHWEIAGLVSPEPLPTYPDGFPEEVITEFERLTGRKVLCNKTYSGTDVIRDYGEEHMKTGDLIVYTSADSVFQIAAHEDVIPIEEQYKICEIAREMLQGKHGVGRVIARPFKGEYPFERTSNRHDYSLLPPKTTMLDLLMKAGIETLSVGKIYDLFGGKSVSELNRTVSNEDGMEKTLEMADRDFNGLCFVNLVDFDTVFGHRNDVPGYAKAMTVFDRYLRQLLPKLRENDLLIITADHGCDPATPSTDHSREYVPMLLYGKHVKEGVDLKTRTSFADISATVLDYFGVDQEDTAGESFLKDCLSEGAFMQEEISDDELLSIAAGMRERSYAPYSNFTVGAALLSKSGKIYTGCNVEVSSYSPTICAERNAFFKAISEGEHEFARLAIVGGKKGETSPFCAPCGVCRQVMAEFCGPEFNVVLGRPGRYKEYRLSELLPVMFTPKDLLE